ncbi:MAG: ribulose-phosphate 3-epimerase [Chloroflexi bacterium]|nr:ribulose-phosphate 3-epimerase [Chloroflexota bacterium]
MSEAARGVVSLAPSILAADFARLGDQMAAVELAGFADRIHVDIMDGQFVPPISFGTLICPALRSATRLDLDVHLMIVRPDRYFAELAEVGVRTVSVHLEACPHVHRDLGEIRRLGMRAGLALNPGTPVDHASEVLDLVDQIVVMTVNPGWGGQPFLEGSVRRVAAARALADAAEHPIDIEVDGGITVRTAPAVVAAGANVLVAGSAVFNHPGGIAAGLRALEEAAQALR